MTLARARIAHSAGYGVVAVGIGTAVSLTDALIGPVDTPVGHSFAFGVVALEGSVAALRTTVVRGTQLAALWTHHGTIDARDVWIEDVRAGDILDAQQGLLTGIGDGILAISPEHLALEAIHIERCARAGIVSKDPKGTLSQSDVRATAVGLATTGPDAEFLGPGNVFDCDQPTWSDSTLVVPDRPLL